MRAWKFLAPGAIAPFTGARWPMPLGPDPGQWLQGRSGEGVHACALGDLPYWLDDELWEVELDAPIFRAAHQLVAARGRLVARIDAWPAAQREFTGSCIERTRSRVVDELVAAGRDSEADQVRAERDLDVLRDLAARVAASGPFVVGYLFDAIRRRPYPGLCAYIAANAAAAIDGQRGYDEERGAEVAWFADGLKIRESR